MVIEKILAAVLAQVTDRALAESIVGDLVQERSYRARSAPLRTRAWFVATVLALVGRAAVALARRYMLLENALGPPGPGS